LGESVACRPQRLTDGPRHPIERRHLSLRGAALLTRSLFDPPFEQKDFHDRTISKEGRRNRAMEMQKTGWVIDPRHSAVMPKWDVTVLLSLLFTAIVSPVEVGFLDEGKFITPLWIVNRVVDLIFTIDIIVTFNVGYQETVDNGGQYMIRCPRAYRDSVA
jgi:hypothetical protein